MINIKHRIISLVLTTLAISKRVSTPLKCTLSILSHLYDNYKQGLCFLIPKFEPKCSSNASQYWIKVWKLCNCGSKMKHLSLHITVQKFQHLYQLNMQSCVNHLCVRISKCHVLFVYKVLRMFQYKMCTEKFELEQ